MQQSHVCCCFIQQSCSIACGWSPSHQALVCIQVSVAEAVPEGFNDNKYMKGLLPHGGVPAAAALDYYEPFLQSPTKTGGAARMVRYIQCLLLRSQSQ